MAHHARMSDVLRAEEHEHSSRLAERHPGQLILGVEADVVSAGAHVDGVGHAQVGQVDRGHGAARVVGHVGVLSVGCDRGDVGLVESRQHLEGAQRVALQQCDFSGGRADHDDLAAVAVGGEVLGIGRDRDPPDHTATREVHDQDAVLGLRGDQRLHGWRARGAGRPGWARQGGWPRRGDRRLRGSRCVLVPGLVAVRARAAARRDER
jgi:hypothetical protein